VTRSLAICMVCVCLVIGACTGGPATTQDTVFPVGRWTNGTACLSATDQGCDLVVGCGHGQFPKPPVQANGTFSIAGTYRIEAGPVSINPAPPANFSGTISATMISITVIPSDPTLQQASFMLSFTSGTGRCTVPCL
jgi:hypothetical protein